MRDLDGSVEKGLDHDVDHDAFVMGEALTCLRLFAKTHAMLRYTLKKV